MSKLMIWNILSVLWIYCDGARILGIVPTPSYSHQIAFRPLWRELSLRGHQLTVLTTDPMNDKSLTNLTEIDLHFSYELWNQRLGDLINKGHDNPLKFIELMLNTSSAVIELQLQHKDVQALIHNETQHFDLLMNEFLFPTMFAFSERFKCPTIAMTSLDAPNGVYQIVGNPTHPVVNPDVVLPFTGKLNFFERVISVLYNLVSRYYYNSLLPKEDLVVEKYFGKGYPSLEEIPKRISMLFVNSDPIFHQIRATVPTVIQIRGGKHLAASKPLPKDLKKYLDEAAEGFIYFSLGTNVKSKDLSENVRNVILQAFSELPYKILWKFELDHLPGKPENVKISKWLPQQDIFKHPNIKLFITQGGLQSMEEAIYNHVPMVGIPFFADQPLNINRMVSKGLGLSLDHKTMNKESFKEAVLEVINNPRYLGNVKHVADLAQDQPMTGLERAVWWTEYVLRHKGAEHLKSPALDLPDYQYYLLDVIGFCILVIGIAVCLFVMVVKLILKLIRYFASKPKIKKQ
ncbi:hypothetical protein ILUMI_27315 [Ignelater luminosus]|uniref:UDP-glucuronosyltransferase n=1 Tax=Ignelater luminosus TaxID=2038154 RepID=A0A8K0FXV3_IGNLU|nr:hypothetical protein ILUMI_27315 [Ignelater luminosus]